MPIYRCLRITIDWGNGGIVSGTASTDVKLSNRPVTELLRAAYDLHSLVLQLFSDTVE